MNGDKASINTNYKLKTLDVTGVTTNTSQQSLSSGIINNHSVQNFDRSSFRQKLDGVYEYRPDTSSSFKIGADATLKNSKTDDNYITSADNGSNVMLNRSNRDNTNNNDQKLVDVSGLYTHKFKKPGRTFSFNLATTYEENHSTGYINSETDFFNPLGGLDSVAAVHQLKNTATTRTVVNSNTTYSEPLSKTFAVIFNYGLGVNNEHADTRSYDKSLSGQYDVFNSAFSNNYQFNQLTNQLGAVFNYKKGKALVNFGTKASAVDFTQVDELTGNVYKRSFINWTPQASYLYKYSPQKAFRVDYSGRTTQPTLEQIQPIRVNYNPLFITLGNPNLKASFTNHINVSYNTYGVVSGQSFYVSGSYNFTTAGIANNTVTNTLTGKSTTQFINLDKINSNYYLYMGFNRKINPIDINAGINVNANSNISYGFINNALNRATSNSYSGRVSVSKYEEDKYNFDLGAGPGYSINQSSLQLNNTGNAATFNANSSGSVELHGGFSVATDVDYNYKAKTKTFDAQKTTIWNASVNKTFFKQKNLKLSIIANNLLDQNTNNNRYASGNTIEQFSSTGIKRYFMFMVTWDFTKFNTIPEKS